MHQQIKFMEKLMRTTLFKKREICLWKKRQTHIRKTKLDFYSPYGCSKGSADQYVNDYARIYNLKTTNFRQSCIYGKYQFGVEDQGWIAWFTIAILLNKNNYLWKWKTSKRRTQCFRFM